MEDAVTEVPPLNHNSEDGSKRKDPEEKEKDTSCGGGVITNFISTLMTPLSPRIGKVNTPQDGVENGVFEKEVDQNGGGRKGVINNLVSNLFHRSENEEGVVKKEDEEIKVDEKVKRLKTENESDSGGDSGGGGFIHDIVSHLPTSIPDDAAPTADEAAILINSLVRD